MSKKAEQVTKDYLTKQLEFERERYETWLENLKINKEMLKSVIIGMNDVAIQTAYQQIAKLTETLQDKDAIIDQLSAQILVLNKLIYDMELRQEEKLKEVNERSEEIKVKLERTENMFQSKEKKWSELERIVVTYARKDHELRKKLTEIKYICDDPSSKRRITTVVEENEVLKSQIDEMEMELDNLRKDLQWAKSNPTYMFEDEEDEFPINNMHFQEEDEVRMDKQLTVKQKALNKSNISDNKSAISDLNNGFNDGSRIDTSNFIDFNNNSALGIQMNLNKSNISTHECSRWKKLIYENQRQAKIISDLQKQSKEKQNLFDSFGALKDDEKVNDQSFENKYNVWKDQVLSGNHIREPNTIELKEEISKLDESLGQVLSKTISYIPYPKLIERMESPIRQEEVFGEEDPS